MEQAKVKIQAQSMALAHGCPKEPVSEGTMTIRKEWFEHCKKSWYNEGYIDGKYNCNMQFEEPVSEDLGGYINELSKQFPKVSFAKLSRIAVRVAKWSIKQAQSMDVAHGCPKESISNVLKEAADNYVGHAPEIDEDLSCITKRNAFKAGAEWQKQQFEKNRIEQKGE